jgi:dihydropteroate synthase
VSSEQVFGALARRLEVRSERTRPEDLRLWFAPRALQRVEHDLLRSLPGADLRAAGDLELLQGPARALREVEGGHPGLSILLRAHENAVAPRPRPRLMGILNVTPDSFSDGGRFASPEKAVEHGLKLVADGAEILDVGGESSRPGAASVSEAEEIRRVLPVIEELARSTSAQISIDTTKSGVARAALDGGATMVNDVSAGRVDDELLALVGERQADVVLMHMQGSPRDMQRSPRYDDVLREVTSHLRERVAAGLRAGIDASRIAIDPGIGFGKRLKDNLDLIRGLPQLRSLGLPIVLGVSRKSFLGRLTGEEDARERLPESLAAIAIGHTQGADIHRVHDVREAHAALEFADAVLCDDPGGRTG